MYSPSISLSLTLPPSLSSPSVFPPPFSFNYSLYLALPSLSTFLNPYILLSLPPSFLPSLPSFPPIYLPFIPSSPHFSAPSTLTHNQPPPFLHFFPCFSYTTVLHTTVSEILCDSLYEPMASPKHQPETPLLRGRVKQGFVCVDI